MNAGNATEPDRESPGPHRARMYVQESVRNRSVAARSTRAAGGQGAIRD